MNSIPDTTARILDLEARQDDALRQLTELERRIDALLAEVAPQAAPPQGVVPAAALATAVPVAVPAVPSAAL